VALAAASIFATAPAPAGGLLTTSFEDASFLVDPLRIDNPYWPLNPAFQYQTFVYNAELEEGCELNRIRIDPTANYTLGGAAPYTGLTTLQVEDKAYFDEQCDGIVVDETDLLESTLDWYAQDDDGNIWYLGETSWSFEDGCPPPSVPVPPAECMAGSWEAGRPGPEEGLIASAGIVVPARPVPGLHYMQELAEGAEDMAKVLRTDARVTLRAGQFAGVYEGCMKTKEYTPLDPGAVEHKFYCPAGPGLVLIEELKAGKTVRVELVAIERP